MIDINTIAIIITIAWCGLQEYRLYNICNKCPFLPKNNLLKNENIKVVN
jgi:hypothetical protein